MSFFRSCLRARQICIRAPLVSEGAGRGSRRMGWTRCTWVGGYKIASMCPNSGCELDPAQLSSVLLNKSRRMSAQSLSTHLNPIPLNALQLSPAQSSSVQFNPVPPSPVPFSRVPFSSTQSKPNSIQLNPNRSNPIQHKPTAINISRRSSTPLNSNR